MKWGMKVLLFVLLLASISFPSLAEESPVSDFEYENHGSYVAITLYNGQDGTVYVPSYIDGLPVEIVTLSKFGLDENPYVRKVVLPETVKKIGDYAFYKFAYMTEIEGLEHVQQLGQYPFMSSGIEEAVFSDALSQVSNGSFIDLKCLTIPDHITWADEPYVSPFNSAFTLESIQLIRGSGSPTITSLDDVIYSADMSTLIYHMSSIQRLSYSIPDQVNRIAYRAIKVGGFANAYGVCELFIPATVDTLDAEGIEVYGPTYFYIEEGCPITNEIIDLCQSSTYTCTYSIGDMSSTLMNRVNEIIEQYISPEMNDIEKVRAIVDWYNDEVVYDIEKFKPVDVLMYGRGLCAAQADAFLILMDNIGLECKVVGNYEHALNAVRINGEWIYVDPTNSRGTDLVARYMYCGYEDTVFEYVWGGKDVDADSVQSKTAKYHYYYTSGMLDEAIADVKAAVREMIGNGSKSFNIDYPMGGLQGRLVAAVINEDAAEFGIEESGFSCVYDSDCFHIDLFSDVSADEFGYEVKNGYACITSYSGIESVVSVPASIGEYEVGYVGSAFAGKTGIIEVKLPDTVIGIENNAFQECIDLETVNMPANLQYIGDSAFEKCSLLSGRFEIPEGTQRIGNLAFGYCQTIEGVSIPSTVTSIGDMAFLYCYMLDEVVLAEGLESLGGACFSGCRALAEITLPNSLRQIDNGCFEGTALRELYIPSSVERLGVSLFSRNGVIEKVEIDPENEVYQCIDDVVYEMEEGNPVTMKFIVPQATVTELVIPDTVDFIDDNAVCYNNTITSLHIPSNVCYIGSNAFAQCWALESITMEDGITDFGGDCVFSNCPYLKTVRLADTLTDLRSALFGVWNLYEVNVPKAMVSVPESTFFATETIHIYVHDDVTYFGSVNCSELCKAVYIHGTPGSYAELRARELGYKFVCADSIGHIEVIDAAVPATHVTTGLTEGSSCSVCGIAITAQEVIPTVEVSAVLTLPAALRIIEDEAFEGGTFACVVISDGCTHIEARAFADCAQLQFVEIPTSVISIDSTAFDGCSEDMVIVASADSEAVSFAENQGMTCVIR